MLSYAPILILHQICPTQCLEELVFAPITKNVIVKYMAGMMSVPLTFFEIFENLTWQCSTASANHDNLAMSTRVEVENALARGDTSESDLRATFRRALSISIPPPIFYRNYGPGARSASDLVFGVPLGGLETNVDNVPKVMRMCVEEVEKRGLKSERIYSVSRSRHVLGFKFSVTCYRWMLDTSQKYQR